MSTGLPREGEFEIVSLNVSDRTGVRKRPVGSFSLEPGKGVAGDAHAGLVDDRQVSLLAVEEIEGASATLAAKAAAKAAESGAAASVAAGGAACEKAEEGMALKPGDFAENITTRGLRLHELPLGTRLEIGGAVLEVSRIGKDCHAACEIRRLVGDCVMPRRGIFARVVEGGEVKREDRGRYRL